MYNLLVKIMVIAALAELGISLTDLHYFIKGRCVKAVSNASRSVTRIEWKPIIIFPEEANRFRSNRLRD